MRRFVKFSRGKTGRLERWPRKLRPFLTIEILTKVKKWIVMTDQGRGQDHDRALLIKSQDRGQGLDLAPNAVGKTQKKSEEREKLRKKERSRKRSSTRKR